MKPQTVAIAGIGSIGLRHLRVLKDVDGVLPIAISRRPAHLKRLAAEGYSVAEDLKRAAEMGARLCIIATETAKHLEDGMSALRHGLDLLVEKPIGIDAREARIIHSAAVEANRSVYTGCTLRFAKSLRTFRSMLDQIGPIHSVRIECRSYLPDWRPDRPYADSYSAGIQGGVLRDLIHEIDYAGWLFGWPTAVYASVRNMGRLGIAAEETADLLWEISNGPTVSISLDYLTRTPRRAMTASGRTGVLSWNGISLDVTLTLVDGTSKVWTEPQERDEMVQDQDMAFINARRGTPDPRLATAIDGIRALAICDAARLASQHRREEKVLYA